MGLGGRVRERDDGPSLQVGRSGCGLAGCDEELEGAGGEGRGGEEAADGAVCEEALEGWVKGERGVGGPWRVGAVAGLEEGRDVLIGHECKMGISGSIVLASYLEVNSELINAEDRNIN